MTHTTNPLMSADTVVKRSLLSRRLESLARPIRSLPSIRCKHASTVADCSPVNHDPDNLIRTQHLEPWFEENSNLYIFTRDSFAATNARIGKAADDVRRPQFFESIDIDSPADWDFAVVAARYLLEHNAP
jgi:CMP-N-acetylneuraminic acid synthetase